jgi:prepilin-type N-terminal cleavage/methylation domain-containing protein
MTKKQKGFTLVELMIVVAIIGVLAAVAIPKFADMLEKSREGATKGNLSAIKSAISNYYADQQGTYPSTLDTRSTYLGGSESFVPFIPQYIETLPGVKVTAKNTVNGTAATNNGPGKSPATAAQVTTGTWSAPAFATTSLGVGWKYNSADGNFWVNSQLQDMAGKSYTIYGFE